MIKLKSLINEEKEAFKLEKEGKLSFEIKQNSVYVDIQMFFISEPENVLEGEITLMKNTPYEEIGSPPPKPGYLFVDYINVIHNGKGFGYLLYKNSLIYAKKNNYKGLVSSKIHRTSPATDVWNKLKTFSDQYYDYINVNDLSTRLKENLSRDENKDIDIDKLFWSDFYLDDIAEKLGYNFDFTKQFWGQHHLPTLYHCTTEERYEKIKTEGLKLKDERRGATSGNSQVGPAVFTTSESEEISFFKSYYGPIVIAINTSKMKADGFTPEVSKEPDWERAEKLEFVLYKLGDKNAEASRYIDSSDQNTQGTIILYSDVPPRYLSLVEHD